MEGGKGEELVLWAAGYQHAVNPSAGLKTLSCVSFQKPPWEQRLAGRHSAKEGFPQCLHHIW